MIRKKSLFIFTTFGLHFSSVEGPLLTGTTLPYSYLYPTFPPSSIYILLSLITFNDDNLDEHDDDGTADDYEYRIKVLYFELELTKGRVPLPNRMNFRKHSKQPSTPSPHFRKIMLQFFMIDMVAYMQGGMMAR